MKQNILVILFFIAAFFYCFYFLGYGIDFSDSPFHFNSVKLYLNSDKYYSPTTFMSTKIMAIWVSMTSESIYSLRVLNLLVCTIIIFLPYLYFNKYLNFKKYFFYGSIVMLAYVSILKSLIGYDTISDFFLINIILSFFGYLKSNKSYFLVLCACFIALNVGARIPNIISYGLVVLVCFVFFCFKLRSLKWFLKSITILTITLLIALFILMHYFYNSFSAYLEDLFFRFGKSNYNTSYDFTALLWRYATNLFHVLKFVILFLFTGYGLYFKIENNQLQLLKNIVIAIILFLILISIGSGYTFIWASLMYTAFFIAITVVFVFSKNKLIQKLKISTILLFALVAAMGSNTGLLKMNTFYYLPLTLILFNHKYIKEIKYILIILVCFALYERQVNFYDDSTLTNLKYNIKSPVLKSIKTSKEKADKVNSVIDLSRELRDSGYELIYLSINSHIFNAVTNTSELIKTQFDRGVDDNQVISKLDEYLQNNNKKTAFIISTTNCDGSPIYSDIMNTKFTRLIRVYDLKRSKHKGFELFLYK